MHVLVGLPDGGGAHGRDVRAGIRLCETEGGELGLLREHSQVLGLDLLRAAQQHRRGGELVGPERGRDRGATPGEFLADQHAVDRRGAAPAISLGELGVHQSNLPSLIDDLLRPSGIPVVFPGDRSDFLLGEVVRQVADAALLFGEGEIKHLLAFLVRTPLLQTPRGRVRARPPPAACAACVGRREGSCRGRPA